MNSENLKVAVSTAHLLGSSDAETLYLIDAKHNCNGKVIVVEASPSIGAITIVNKNRLLVEYDLFDENALIDSDGTQHEQCEGVFWPRHDNYQTDWIFCVETKYTRDATTARNPKNNYPQKMISQLCSTVFWFRDHAYLDEKRRVYCIPSFPTVVEFASMSSLFCLPQNRFFVKGESLSIIELAEKYKILIRYALKIDILTVKRIKFNSEI